MSGQPVPGGSLCFLPALTPVPSPESLCQKCQQLLNLHGFTGFVAQIVTPQRVGHRAFCKVRNAFSKTHEETARLTRGHKSLAERGL